MDDLGWSDELSDLTSSEDESDALAVPLERTTRTSARPPKAIYVVREQLKPYRNTQYTVESLYREFAWLALDSRRPNNWYRAAR